MVTCTFRFCLREDVRGIFVPDLSAAFDVNAFRAFQTSTHEWTGSQPFWELDISS